MGKRQKREGNRTSREQKVAKLWIRGSFLFVGLVGVASCPTSGSHSNLSREPTCRECELRSGQWDDAYPTLLGQGWSDWGTQERNNEDPITAAASRLLGYPPGHDQSERSSPANFHLCCLRHKRIWQPTHSLSPLSGR